jgi:hypothetical protein
MVDFEKSSHIICRGNDERARLARGLTAVVRPFVISIPIHCIARARCEDSCRNERTALGRRGGMAVWPALPDHVSCLATRFEGAPSERGTRADKREGGERRISLRMVSDWYHFAPGGQKAGQRTKAQLGVPLVQGTSILGRARASIVARWNRRTAHGVCLLHRSTRVASATQRQTSADGTRSVPATQSTGIASATQRRGDWRRRGGDFHDGIGGRHMACACYTGALA